MPRDDKSNDMKNIAVICRSAYGDLICTLPLIYFLNDTFQPNKFTLFVDSKNVAIVDFFPDYLDIVELKARGNKYFIIWSAALRHRKNKYDLVVCGKPRPWRLYNIFTWLLGARERYAMIGKDSWHARLVNNSKRIQAGTG